MSRERWERVQEVYNSALERLPGGRPGLLRESCGGDHELRRDVESLLHHGASEEAFLERPAKAGEQLDRHTSDRTRGLTSRRVCDYPVLDQLGEGGMGAVYEARYIFTTTASSTSGVMLRGRPVRGRSFSMPEIPSAS